MNELVGTTLLAVGFILGQVTKSMSIKIKYQEQMKRSYGGN